MNRREQIRIATLAIDDVLNHERGGVEAAARRVVAELAEAPTKRVARLFGQDGWQIARVFRRAGAHVEQAERDLASKLGWTVRVRHNLTERDGTEWIAVEVKSAKEQAQPQGDAA